jgi:hypothetical protein
MSDDAIRILVLIILPIAVMWLMWTEQAMRIILPGAAVTGLVYFYVDQTLSLVVMLVAIVWGFVALFKQHGRQ